MIELNHRVEPDPDVVITELEGKEAVLLNLSTKMYYTLNETGLRIWQMLSSGRTFGEISETLSGEFDVIGELTAEKLVKVVDE